MKTIGLLLAAGRGQRFDPSGRHNKLLAPLPGGGQVVTASAAAMLAVLPRVIAVVPSDGEVADALRALGCEVTICSNAADGMATSLVHGLRFSLPHAGGWVVGLGDMPHVAPSTITALRNAIENGAEIAAPFNGGKRGNPVAFSATCLPQLLALQGDQGARALLNSGDVRVIDVDDPGIFHDIDTPSDLHKTGPRSVVRIPSKTMKKPAQKKQASIQYAIVPKDLAGHLFEVSVTVASPARDGQVFALPAWIPGSYMIREFSRNIVQIRAESGGKAVALKKLDKHSWRAAPVSGPLTVVCDIYAWDLSVRAAHLDQTHGFFNGTSLCLRVVGQEALPHQVDIQRPADPAAKTWRVATSLPELGAKRYGFGTYLASDYDELIDHPVEMGDFALASFKAHGIPHDIVISGRVPNLDMARLQADLKAICETQIAFFEPRTKRAPMDRYVFLTLAVGDGYGGLEHRASTALICARADLPATAGGKGAEISDGYLKFLGLCSHEYFHTWNVKRIKPAVFAPYDLQSETYTPLLWLFEGFTSYYDDLMLVRSGLIDEAAYLKLLGKTIGSVLRGSGRTKQSVADSSFDAWGKYYRQDENAPNAIVSYYGKGSLIALAFDLTIREKTRGKKSLDDVMLAFWQRYGRDFYAGAGRGVTEAEVEALFDEISGLKLGQMFERYVRGTVELPLSKLYASFGVKLADERRTAKPSFDASLGRDGNDVKLSQVHEGGAAHRAGLSAGDLLVAIDGLRVSGAPSGVDAMLSRYKVGETVAVHAFRRDELMTFQVKLMGERVPGISLTVTDARKKSGRPSAPN